jgi:hypothetical protein
MPGSKKPGPSIKNPVMYEELKQQGMPKGMAAAISNAQASKGKGKSKGKG